MKSYTEVFIVTFHRFVGDTDELIKEYIDAFPTNEEAYKYKDDHPNSNGFYIIVYKYFKK